MYSDFQSRAEVIDEEIIDYEQELKLIFDLTRRIHLLEELMQSARARRESTFDDVSVAVAPRLM